MHRAFRLALFAVLVALFPLRGMAAVVADRCGSGHGGGMQASHDCCAEDDAPIAASHHGDQEQSSESSCSHCVACSVGALVLLEIKPARPDAIAGAIAIPFRDRRAPGFVPEVLDRPPLAL